jgi:tripartite-type tricarboxylate transporter receptor subunit TctC
MPLTIKRALRLLLLSTTLPLASISTQAAEWPTDTVRLVVPYAPGGTTDILSRKVADLLQQQIGTVVVENRPGAGSTMATGQLVSCSTPAPDRQ